MRSVRNRLYPRIMRSDNPYVSQPVCKKHSLPAAVPDKSNMTGSSLTDPESAQDHSSEANIEAVKKPAIQLDGCRSSKIFNVEQMQLINDNLDELNFSRSEEGMGKNQGFLDQLNGLGDPGKSPITLVQLANKLGRIHRESTSDPVTASNIRSRRSSNQSSEVESMVTRSATRKRSSPDVSPVPTKKRATSSPKSSPEGSKDMITKKNDRHTRTSPVVYTSIQNKITELKGELATNVAINDGLRRRLDFAEASYQTLRMENNRLTSVNDRLVNEFIDNNRRVETFRRQYDAWFQERQLLKLEISALEKHHALCDVHEKEDRD